MRCRACDAPLDASGVFPGGAVRCACGVDNVTPGPHGSPATHDPYREPAPHAPSAPTPAHSRDLGPLCPRCTRLLHEDPERATLACDKCRGDFVDHASLAARIDAERPRDHTGPPSHAPRVSSPETEVHYAWCPECGKVMGRMTFGKRSGIVVDVCRGHGTWFDGGELDAVMGFVREGGLEADLAAAPPPAADPGARAMEATLTVQLMHEQQEDEELVKDVAYLLSNPLRRLQRRW
jgi:Zn-finger nucleic acid-binding protein